MLIQQRLLHLPAVLQTHDCFSFKKLGKSGWPAILQYQTLLIHRVLSVLGHIQDIAKKSIEIVQQVICKSGFNLQ